MYSTLSLRFSFAQTALSFHHHFRLYPKLPITLKPFLNPSLCPPKTMSNPKKSAFDVMMSNASKKKTPQTQKSSPKKRKNEELNAPVQNTSSKNLIKDDLSKIEGAQIGKSSKNGVLEEDLSKIEGAQIGKSSKNGVLEEDLSKIEGAQIGKSSKNGGLEGGLGDLRKIGDAQIVDLGGNGGLEGGCLNLGKIEDAQIEKFGENGGLKGGCLNLRKIGSAQIGDLGKKGVLEGGSSAKERKLSPDESVSELRKKGGSFEAKKAAYWGEGERVPFMFLVKGLDVIASESSRIVMTEILCNMLRTVMETTPDDLVAFVYLLGNKIAPAHEGVELGLGDASIIKALAEACGAKEAHIKKQYKELGDLGLVAKASRSSQPLMRKPEILTVAKVLDTFRIIAKESGNSSQEKKKNHIKGLLVAATDCEPLYLIRLLQTKLRIGLAEQTLLTALGHAAVYSGKEFPPPKHIASPLEEAAKIVKQVYSVIPVYDKIIAALLAGGVWDLPKTCCFSPGVPIGPMLAKPTKGVSEILDKFQDIEFTCEYKYDGERAQIHYLDDGSVEIYSRNSERNTGKFPDVAAAVTRLKNPSVTSFVLDCELVAFDREKQRILPFQVLSTRARKNVVISEIKVEVCIYAFDMLYLDGQSLLQDQLNIRREKLYKSFVEEPGFFQYATAISSNDLEAIQTFLDTAVNASCEGLIIKTLNTDATYEPSKRSNNWLKLKKDYMDSVGDSLDLVPIAAFYGRGKRTGVYGAFLLACYDSSQEEFQSICKIGTGFSEAVLEERSTSLRAKVIPKPKSYFRYSDSLNPDVWFEPTEVWEVKAADLTISPVHRAAVGIVDPNKGISLRFPRLLRIREDKNPEQASSSEMVAEMYSAQKHNHKDQTDKEDE